MSIQNGRAGLRPNTSTASEVHPVRDPRRTVGRKRQGSTSDSAGFEPIRRSSPSHHLCHATEDADELLAVEHIVSKICTMAASSTEIPGSLSNSHTSMIGAHVPAFVNSIHLPQYFAHSLSLRGSVHKKGPHAGQSSCMRERPRDPEGDRETGKDFFGSGR
jgi:hypothetical protein